MYLEQHNLVLRSVLMLVIFLEQKPPHLIAWVQAMVLAKRQTHAVFPITQSNSSSKIQLSSVHDHRSQEYYGPLFL